MTIQTKLFYFLLLILTTGEIFAGRGVSNRRKKKEEQKHVIHQNHQHNALPYGTHTHIDTNAIAAMPRPQFRPQDLNFKKTVLDNPLISIEQSTPLSKTTPIVVPPTPPCPPEIEEANIEFNFENADLQNFIQQIEALFDVTFITADALKPPVQGQKEIRGNKISFKTHKSLTKKEAWDLFVTFLDTAGFSVIPHTDPNIYRIVSAGPTAQKSPLPTFIGVDYTTLPDTDDLIRYLYFIENSTVDTIEGVLSRIISNPSVLIMLKEHKGFILTDKAYNIKMLMKIVKELDKTTVPEAMTVVKLRNAIAKDVADLYKELIPKEDQSRFFAKKQPSLYFPENTKIIPEPRTNALILLGPKNAIDKIEHFIIKYVDIELDQAYSPLYHYQLKYATAEVIADIMNNVTKDFSRENPEATKYGGVRGIDQFMREITFTAEKSTNRIIIKGHYEDYLKAKEILEKLDEEQPQVAVEALVLTVDVTDTKSIGAQLRSKYPGPNGLLGNNIKFQTSGFFGQGIVTRPDDESSITPGVNRLLGNLINLVTGTPVGSSLLTLGQDIYGVWGIFEALQSITDSEIVANPFLLATNNTSASVQLGQRRRGITADVVGAGNTAQGFGNFDAFLKVEVTPQINSDGMILLNLKVNLDDFTNNSNFADVTKNMRVVETSATVADKEVIALGGLIRDNVTETVSKVPVLGDIPILGWFFKNKTKTVRKQSLLILLSTQIVEPHKKDTIKEFTDHHTKEYQSDLDGMYYASDRKDPIHRAFFQDKQERARKTFEGFLFEREERTKQREQEKIDQEKTEKEKLMKSVNNVAHNKPPETEKKSSKNKLISTIHNKKRTQLSLTEFLQNAEERS